MRHHLLTILFFACLYVQASAYAPSEVPNPRPTLHSAVSNPDAILSDSDIVFLDRCALRLAQATQAEMAVVAIDAMADGYDAFTFAYQLFQRWGIGLENKNTGVLLFFVRDSHDIRIMTGVGIEGVLTDAVCSRIIQEEMIPSFRRGRYGEGLCLGALRIYEICTDGEAPDELRAMRSVTNRGGYDDDELSDGAIFTIMGVCLAVALLCFLIAYWAAFKRCPQCGKRRAHPTREQILVAATYAAAGQGLRTYCCNNCGNTFNRTFVIPRRQRTIVVTGGGHSSMGGGSFGGSFGGGSTMGGGAGGKW